MDDKTAMRAGVGTGKKIAYLTCILLILLLCAEVGWRLHLRRIGKGFFDDRNEFTSPFFTSYEEPMPLALVGGNELWYRNGMVRRQKPSNEIRIICFGGSTTVNWRAGISYPELLERKFAPAYKGYTVRVLNAGGDGYSTAHILVNFTLRNLDAQPDIITVYENINDLSVAWFGESVASDYGNKYKTDFFLGYRHRTGVLAELTKVSRLARSAVFQVKALAMPTMATRQAKDDEYDRVLELFRRNLTHIVASARANRIRVLLASQAAGTPVRTLPGFMAFNGAIRTLAEKEGIAFVDIGGMLLEDRLFLPDNLHNNRAGVEAIAEAWYPPLRELVDQLIEQKKRALH